MTEELPEPDPVEKASEAFTEKSIYKAVGKYTLVVVFIIAASLMSMGFGWPWWIAGLGPIVLIPIAGWSWSMALDRKIKGLVK